MLWRGKNALEYYMTKSIQSCDVCLRSLTKSLFHLTILGSRTQTRSSIYMGVLKKGLRRLQDLFNKNILRVGLFITETP